MTPRQDFINKCAIHLQGFYARVKLGLLPNSIDWIQDDYRLGIWCAEIGQENNCEYYLANNTTDKQWGRAIREIRKKAGL